MKIKTTQLNAIIDTLVLIAFVALASTGFLMHLVLPQGSGFDSQIWGLDRYDWSQIHFWSAIGFLGVLSVHLFLHWRWIFAVVRGRDSEHSGRRMAFGLAALLLLLAVAAAPLLSPVQERTDGIELRGSMSLQELERVADVPVKRLLSELDLPPDLPRRTRLRTLRTDHNISMREIQIAIEKLSTP